MNTSDRLNLRARQILDDPTLPQNQRLPNAGALFKQLAESVKDTIGQRESLLAELSDPVVRDAMDQALAAVGA